VASIVGWVLVALIVYAVLGALLATIGFLVRFILWAVVIGALITLYVNLRSPDD
jgi:hypothetical protein